MSNKIRLSPTVDLNSSNVRITTTTPPSTSINSSADTAFLLGHTRNDGNSTQTDDIVDDFEKSEPDTWGGSAPT